MVAQIAAASEQQSSASEQISKNVEAISAVTGQTASGTQQIARAAEDLNRLTDNLQGYLAKFKLSGDAQTVKADRAPRPRDGDHKQKRGTTAVRENGALVPHEQET
jgi:methyl-accepting chemotaxis protein